MNKIDIFKMYLGCKCLLPNGKLGTLTGINLTKENLPLISVKFGEKPTDVFISSDIEEINKVKLCLRKISSITPTEEKELKVVMKNASEGKNLLHEIKVSHLLCLYFNKENPNITLWLINKGFNVFNLEDNIIEEHLESNVIKEQSK